MRIATLAISLLLAASLAGCAQESHQTQKEAAKAQWNAARAGVLQSLAKDQYESGNFDKCRATLKEALSLEPKNVKLHTLSAKLAIEQGELDHAESELNLAREIDPKDAETDYLSGVIYQRWQKPQEALDAYTRAGEKAPTELAYVLARSEMLVVLDRPADALTLLQDHVIYFEHSAEIRDAVGQLLVQQKRYPEAVEMLRQASILATEDATIREHLAMAMLKNHQYREAGALVERLLKDPANQMRAELHLALGECRLELGRVTEARASFETAVQLKPSMAQGYNYIARAALALNDNRRADLAIRKSLTLDGKRSETHLLLGYLRVQEKKFDEALASFKRSSELDKSDTVSLCMIGYVLEKTGKSAQALPYYAKALQIHPDDEMASKMIATIDSREE